MVLIMPFRCFRLKGLTFWKEDPHSPYYDADLVNYKLEHMQKFQAKEDYNSMHHLLRNGMVCVL